MTKYSSTLKWLAYEQHPALSILGLLSPNKYQTLKATMLGEDHFLLLRCPRCDGSSTLNLGVGEMGECHILRGEKEGEMEEELRGERTRRRRGLVLGCKVNK